MKVVYRLEALGDLNNLFSYIKQDNHAAADRVSKRIQRTVERLADFPLTARRGAVEGTYELVVPRIPYLVVYRVHAFVEILAIYHDRQNRPKS